MGIDKEALRNDPGLAFVERLLDEQSAQPLLHQCLRQWKLGTDSHDDCTIDIIRVVRHKPGRRCLIEYGVSLHQKGKPSQPMTLMGKVRARGLDRRTYELQNLLWDDGFYEYAEDGISVPEPIGVIPEFHMWLYRKVEGVPAGEILEGPEGITCAQRIAQVAYKLHRRGYVSTKCHTMEDELAILQTRLEEVMEGSPHWCTRVHNILIACQELSQSSTVVNPTGIHRDFYADQILIKRSHCTLIDMDLFCVGDPSLDIGNFVGHMTEQSLRHYQDPFAMKDKEEALIQAYLQLAGPQCHWNITIYTLLTLARHISLSTQMPERYATTEPLIRLCEMKIQKICNPTP